ncbi:MAG: ATP-binding protein [Candidatus Gastranaerophilaceae bacterium]
MILVNPIKPYYSVVKSGTNYPNRKALSAKPDSFECKTYDLAFTGMEKEVSLRFPLKETEALLENFYKKIVKEQDIIKKQKLADSYTEQFQKIRGATYDAKENVGKEEGYFIEYRGHEIYNPICEFFILLNKIEEKKSKNIPIDVSAQEFDDSFKYMLTRTINSIKRFELFLDMGLEKGITEPKQVFQLALDSVKEKAEKNSVKIKLIGEDILNEYKGGIYNRFYRFSDFGLYGVFSNIISNATKYTEKGSEVVIKFEKSQMDDENYLIFSVLDKGIGFPKEEQEKILECGGRASNAIASGIEGTGHGLKRVKKTLDNFDYSPLEIDSPINPENKDFPGSKISCYIRLKD